MEKLTEFEIGVPIYLDLRSPLKEFSYNGVIRSYFNLCDDAYLTKKISDAIYDFMNEGFTESRVRNAYEVSCENSVVYIKDLDANKGVGICFSGKFYKIYGNMSEQKMLMTLCPDKYDIMS